MTDNEIIKYLEQAIDKYNKNEIFVDNIRLDKLSLDIIKRQQAEIERLKKLLTEEEAKYNKCAKLFYIAGVKEFAKRLKDYYINHNEYKRPYAHTWIDFLFDVTDNLVAELVGERNETV